jgi:hypothetical protein
MRVYLHGPLGAIADAVTPVVFVREATAGPAHDGHLEILQRLDDVVAIAVGIRDRGFLADPYAFIDAGAQVLGELTIDVRVDDRARLIGAHRDLHRRGLGGRRRTGYRRERDEKCRIRDA